MAFKALYNIEPVCLTGYTCSLYLLKYVKQQYHSEHSARQTLIAIRHDSYVMPSLDSAKTLFSLSVPFDLCWNCKAVIVLFAMQLSSPPDEKFTTINELLENGTSD